MEFVNRTNLNKLIGTHAPFSPSSPSWMNYNDDKVREYIRNSYAKKRGTELHQLAAMLITHQEKLPRLKRTLNQYVNDAIGFQMRPEVLLYFSDFIYGTADTIKFDGSILRIHDLKTGKTPSHMEQLEIYSALYCLQEGINPHDIRTDLRIYQADEQIKETFDPDIQTAYMRRIERIDEIARETEGEFDEI